MKVLCPGCMRRPQGKDGLCIECYVEFHGGETDKRRLDREHQRRRRERQKENA